MQLIKKVKNIFIGKSRDIKDNTIFHKLTLVAFFAWVGLGADGLSSSCYGPQEAFLALNGHVYLSIFVGLASAITIFIISASYSQIVELFPTGGGGYLVASKLLSPTAGMVSGCALLIDYVLTITVSIASGADAIFSLLPLEWHSYRLTFAVCAVVVMMILNMRGVKESILPLIPIFLLFLATHIFIIFYVFFKHSPELPQMATTMNFDFRSAVSQVGFFGVIFLILRAYSMGAGTYTGLEAVSNGIPVLRDPKVETAKKTMKYMAFSLAFIVLGLMLSYLFCKVSLEPGKTLNAVLFQRATQSWNADTAYIFIFLALASEAALLFVGAQAGFLDGPRVLANMALDRWFPGRFSTLSDRLVAQNGIFIMSVLAVIIMFFTGGSVQLLVILYSINVFITFVLSQLGMVRHWWMSRSVVKAWYRKLFVNGIGLVLTASILISMIIFKFFEGGWVTLLITSILIASAIFIKRHYYKTIKILHRLNSLVSAAEAEASVKPANKAVGEIKFDPKAKTAVLLASGFNGMGLHTLFGIMRLFGGAFKNFVFVEIGVVDTGNFKGAQELDHLQAKVNNDLGRYAALVNKSGFYAKAFSAMGVDVIEEVDKLSPKILEEFPNAVFFGGQLVFPEDSFILRMLHNHTVFTLQKRLYRQGTPFVILPIRV